MYAVRNFIFDVKIHVTIAWLFIILREFSSKVPASVHYFTWIFTQRKQCEISYLTWKFTLVFFWWSLGAVCEMIASINTLTWCCYEANAAGPSGKLKRMKWIQCDHCLVWLRYHCAALMRKPSGYYFCAECNWVARCHWLMRNDLSSMQICSDRT